MITQLKAHYLMSKTTLSMGSLDVDSLWTDILFDTTSISCLEIILLQFN